MANTITYNANMQAPLRTFWLDDDIEEMQQMTAAFLTDRYENGAGAYVATPDDIAELEKATATFLADRYDGECLCWDEPGHGLLLPGEQYLLPVSAAVAIARAESPTGEDILSQIDELLHEQMEYEDVLGTALLDAVHEPTNASSAEYISSDKILGPNLLPNTPPMGGRTVVSFKSELTSVAMEAILNLPDELDRILGIYDDDDSDDEDEVSIGSDPSTVAFDPHTVLSHSQASYAASFFDPDTQTMVPYASLDSILLFEEQHSELPTTLQVRCEGGDDEEEDEDNEDEDLTFQHMENGDYFEHLDDDYTLLEVSTVQHVKYSQFKFNTFLSPIKEEHEPSSAASDCSMDFADLRGSVMPLAQRQQGFLDDDISVSESSPDLCEQVLDVLGGLFAGLCEEALKALDGVFANEIWKHEPDLEFSFTDDIGENEAYLELAFSA